jgi:hypothetical protein
MWGGVRVPTPVWEIGNCFPMSLMNLDPLGEMKGRGLARLCRRSPPAVGPAAELAPLGGPVRLEGGP